MDIEALLRPRCPNHPDYLIEDHGVCVVCLMSSHRHLSGFRLITGDERRGFRSEDETYDEGLYDDD